MITDEQIADACNKAYLEAGQNAYFGNGFEAGVKFTIEQLTPYLSPKFVQSSWLDHHVLNEDSEFKGAVIKHDHTSGIYGGVCVKTHLGNFAIITEHQEDASKNIGKQVSVKPHRDYYGTVMILKYY